MLQWALLCCAEALLQVLLAATLSCAACAASKLSSFCVRLRCTTAAAMDFKLWGPNTLQRMH